MGFFFQVKGAMISLGVAVVRSGIVNSVWGEAREVVGFIDFDVSLDVTIDKIEECYSKTWNADQLQQEFYQLKQDKSRKVQFGGLV